MNTRYTVEVSHSGLGKFRVISGTDPRVVQAKARSQRLAWDATFQKREESERAKDRRQSLVESKERRQADAKERSEKATAEINEIKNLLKHALLIGDAVDWDKLLNNKPYSVPEPRNPTYSEYPVEPQPTELRFQPQLSFLDKLLNSRTRKRRIEAKNRFQKCHSGWSDETDRIREANDAAYALYLRNVAEWNLAKKKYESKRANENGGIIARKNQYLASDGGAICDYCELVLSNSSYPAGFPQDFQLDYNPQTKILLIDYSLPAPEELPRVKEVKYIKSKNEFSEALLSDSESNKLYDDAIYQICLRTLHEIYEADTVAAIDSIVFNGWVTSIDKANGKEVTACIVTVQTLKSEFQQINLESVDAKACFKALKGVGSSKLHGITPVAPILVMNREDKRFVPSHDVAEQLDEGSNLAAMDWEEFEHLIREVFAAEFSQSGGEVKVTQASRDGGVDAVVFDPDPIRGGKTIIQAKRYTNTVGVSAVRDLYGTIMNEGASKGILVTTSDYGPDAYDFAKGKPIVLLNGGNLLHLLQKHGHKARIDLQEAKQVLSSMV